MKKYGYIGYCLIRAGGYGGIIRGVSEVLKQRKNKKGTYPERVERKEIKMMRKFKCESDFMAESKRIYRAYVEEEKKLKGLIDETNLLKDLTNEAKERETKKIQQEISEKRAGMKTLLSNLENDFADWAFEFADLTGEGLDRKLATALSSGISYSPQELLYLAKKAGNNQADARLLHDYAKSHGYELKNYVSPDQKIEKFHKMNETFGKFADDEDGKNWLRLPDAEIDIFVGNQLSSVEIMPENMEIRTVAKSIDEEISRDIAENEKKKAENADKDGEFLNGFGVDPEEPDTNFYKPEDDATENVSPEEESENVDQ